MRDVLWNRVVPLQRWYGPSEIHPEKMQGHFVFSIVGQLVRNLHPMFSRCRLGILVYYVAKPRSVSHRTNSPDSHRSFAVPFLSCLEQCEGLGGRRKEKAGGRRTPTLTGTVLGMLPLLGVFYFIYITTRVLSHTPVLCTHARLETRFREMIVSIPG